MKRELLDDTFRPFFLFVCVFFFFFFFWGGGAWVVFGVLFVVVLFCFLCLFLFGFGSVFLWILSYPRLNMISYAILTLDPRPGTDQSIAECNRVEINNH